MSFIAIEPLKMNIFRSLAMFFFQSETLRGERPRFGCFQVRGYQGGSGGARNPQGPTTSSPLISIDIAASNGLKMMGMGMVIRRNPTEASSTLKSCLSC